MPNINKVIYGNTTLIDLTDATLGANNGNQILKDQTAYGKDGALITGTCTYNADTSDADVSAGEILYGKIAYANGNKLVGTMPNNGAVTGNITTKAQQYSIPAGYHDGSGYVQVSSTEQAKIIAGNIRNGVQILGVTGTYAGESVPTQVKSATPYTTAQTILPDAGYNLSQVNVSAIYYNEAPNSYGTTVTIGTVAPV